MSTIGMINYHFNSIKIRRVSPYQFRLAVKERFKWLKGKRRRQVYRRLNLIHYKYPFIVERKVQTAISKISKRFVHRFENWFKSHIDTWKEQRKRYDSWESQVDFFLRDLEKEMDLFYADPVSFGVNIERQAKTFSEYIHVLVERELGRQVDVLLGEMYLGSDNWWNDVQSLWIKEYTDRIKNLTSGYITRMRETVFTGVKENWTFEKIEQHIAALNESFTKTRVKFIARDLVGALNGIVEQKSQQDIGIDTYLWNTMADERVRGRPGGLYANAIPSHWAMDGKICDWRNSSIYSSDMKNWFPRTMDMPKDHPGIDWACRCMGRAFFIPLLHDIEKETEGEGNS